MSFSFTFFVHGDTVCASIDLREHPAVRPLTKEHLAEAAAAFAAASAPPGSSSGSSSGPGTAPGGAGPNPSQEPNGSAMDDAGEGGAAKATPPAHPRKVMLAPFGIAAILTGNSYKANDPMAEKILEDWASFFPLCNKDNTDLPPVVEVVSGELKWDILSLVEPITNGVLSGGHKMYHPTNYVLVTDLDDMEHMEHMAELQKLQMHNAAGHGASEAAALASLSCPPVAGAAAPIAGAPGTAVPVGPASASAKEASRKTAPQVVSALERLSFQPYYDQRPTSGFTFNTNNTHIPATAAVEMPERTWQDCIMNTLHVDAAAAAASARSAGPDASATGEEEDSKQQVQQQLQQQQQQQRHKLWNFVDPMQKAPCTCTK